MNDPRYLQQPYNTITWIDDGEAGANRYPVAAGNSVALFDKNEKRFFIKSVDISGMPMPLREFKYEEVVRQQESQPIASNYITKSEFDDFQVSVLTKVDEMMQKYFNSTNNNKKNNTKGE